MVLSCYYSCTVITLLTCNIFRLLQCLIFQLRVQVREHKRKVRKEAKKHGNKGKNLRKDPGVPNDAPFKEDILREAEKRKQDVRGLS